VRKPVWGRILAFGHGFSRPQYGKYEAGANITFAKLTKVLKALGVAPEEFLRSIFLKTISYNTI
jgi:transcriptional regulator with XRE-family HTH domain